MDRQSVLRLLAAGDDGIRPHSGTQPLLGGPVRFPTGSLGELGPYASLEGHTGCLRPPPGHGRPR